MTAIPKIKLTKCKICRTLFKKTSISHKVCSPECAVKLVEKEKEKTARKVYLAEKERLKSRRDWMREAQTAFNAFIRKRDEGQPCISCGRHHTGQYHAGHYLSTGARPELRFNEDNCHKQCSVCNNYLSGNIALYRINLIAKIGLKRVEQLEGPTTPQKWTVDDLRAVKREYQIKIRESAQMGMDA